MGGGGGGSGGGEGEVWVLRGWRKFLVISGNIRLLLWEVITATAQQVAETDALARTHTQYVCVCVCVCACVCVCVCACVHACMA